MTINTESRLLQLIRPQYEAEGYSFYEYPQSDVLPPFMRGYRPDAIALGPDKKIAIEIKRRRGAGDQSLEQLSRLFQSHPDWVLQILYSDEFDDERSKPSSKAEIDRQIDQAEALLKIGHERAALVLAWAALEAASRAIDHSETHARSPGQVLELLEQMGRLDHQKAKVLRNLLTLRNAAVHGDYGHTITGADVVTVLAAARTANTG